MASNNTKRINSQAEMDKSIKSICDILRRDKAKGARLYVPELTWILFLRFLDFKEQEEKERNSALNLDYQETLKAPYRWYDWAAPYKANQQDTVIKDKLPGWKRAELDKEGKDLIQFVNKELFPHMMNLSGTQKEKVIAHIFKNKKNTILKSDTNLKDVLDKVHNLTEVDDKHMFPISQAYEGLLPSLGEKKNDGGQFFTPREIVRVIVEAVKPEASKTVYDPCCGTSGFLIEAYKYMMSQNPAATVKHELNTEKLWGREQDDDSVSISLANMLLHGVELPRIWHGNTLTGDVDFGDLFAGAPIQFDYIFTNPPFGSKESKSAQANFAYKSGKAQILFIQHFIDSLADDGTCGMVIDEGVMFHTKTKAYQQTKRKLLSECNLWCVISLPQGVFVNAGAGAKTNLLFFTKGKQTERVWYYDMTLTDDLKPRKVNKGNPLNFEHFKDFFERLALDPDDNGRISETSWYQTYEEIEAKNFDLKAINENAPDTTDKRTPAELLEIIKQSQTQITESIKNLEDN